MPGRVKRIAGYIRRQAELYRLVLRDDRTPRRAKWLLAAAIAYAACPVDLIPDFIPVLGHLDDVLIVPALFALARRMVPQQVLDDCRAQLTPEHRKHEMPARND